MPRRSIFWWLNHRFLEFFKEHEDILVKDGLLYNSQPVSQVVSENAKKIREMSNLLKAADVGCKDRVSLTTPHLTSTTLLTLSVFCSKLVVQQVVVVLL